MWRGDGLYVPRPAVVLYLGCVAGVGGVCVVGGGCFDCGCGGDGGAGDGGADGVDVGGVCEGDSDEVGDAGDGVVDYDEHCLFFLFCLSWLLW